MCVFLPPFIGTIVDTSILLLASIIICNCATVSVYISVKCAPILHSITLCVHCVQVWYILYYVNALFLKWCGVLSILCVHGLKSSSSASTSLKRSAESNQITATATAMG